MSEEKTTAVAQKAATAVATKKTATVAELVKNEAVTKELSKVLPSGLDVAKFLAMSNSQFRKNPAILSCTPASVFNCMMTCARVGVIPDGRNAYLIPYGNECTVQFDYKGFVDILIRNGIVTKVHADIVCENDDFQYNLGEVEAHRIKLGNRGEVIGAYAIAYLPNGNKKCEVMEKAEIEAVRSKSRNAQRGPWVDFYGEMCKKVVFKRLTKWLKVTPDIAEAIEKDNEEFNFNKKTPTVGSPIGGILAPNSAIPKKEEKVDDAIDVGTEEKSEEQLQFS